MNSSNNTRAIDVHAHFGASIDQTCDLVNQFMTASAEEVVTLAGHANVEYTCVSPLSAIYGSHIDVILAGNLEASRIAALHKELRFWAVVNPLMPESFAQADDLLENPSCVGIKIHPQQHNYKIADYGDMIFKFAANHHAVLQSHSGCVNSQPLDFVCFADNYPDVRLIVSHLGNNWDDDVTQQVRAIEKSKHGNVFTDTSSSKSIIPNLIEWAVKEVGSHRILFGSDSPLYFVPMQRARIDNALISELDRMKILRENALILISK